MNRSITSSVASFFTLLCSVTTVQAQSDSPTWAPLEIFGCNFVDEQDMSDLDAVIETWNLWMDENDINTYTALTLTPHFTSADFPFDILWLGVWADSTALGGTQLWLEEGGEVQSDFNSVIDCPLHQGLAISEIKAPAEDSDNGLLPVEFTNCTIHEGRTGPEAHAALIEWADYLTENGSDAGQWVLRPGPGEDPEADYSFKWVTGFSSWDSVAHDFELYYNEGGDQTLNELTGRLMSCDAPRFYNGRVVRQAAQELDTD